MSFQKVVASIAVALMLVGTSYATTVSHTLTVTGEYDTVTGALITASPATATTAFNTGIAAIYRLQVNSLLQGLASNQVYGGELFDLVLSGATRAPQAAGTGSKANYGGSATALPAGAQDANGNAVAGNVLSNNADQGISTTDLLAITTVVNSNAVGALFDGSFNSIADPRTSFGVGSAANIGTVYVRFTNDGDKVTLQNSTYINYVYAVDGNGISTGQLETTPVGTTGASIIFHVPEPASMVLMGLGGLGLVGFARRRRS